MYENRNYAENIIVLIFSYATTADMQIIQEAFVI
jgi:hypothetical protein